MIDTVFLNTTEFAINKTNRLDMNVLTRHTGEYTEKYFLNFAEKCNELQLASHSLPAHGGITVHDLFGAQMLFFNVSLPKLIYGHSLAEVTQDDYGRCVDAIHKQLSFAGIDIDRRQIEQMKLGRLDYCRNITVDHDILDYIQIIASCAMPYMTPDHMAEAGTALFKNGVQQFTVYDKINDVVDDPKQRMAARIVKDTPHNILRFEKRIMAGKHVKNITGKRTFAECYNTGMSRMHLLKTFDKLQINIDAQSALENNELSYLFENFTHVQIRNYMAGKAILQAVNYNFDLLRHYVSLKYKDKQLRNIMAEYRQIFDMIRTPKQRSLFKEMRHKLAA